MTVTSSVQLFGIACLSCLAIVRAMMLRSQKVSVLIVDRSRTGIQVTADALLALALLYWLSVTVAYCFAAQYVFVPEDIDRAVWTNAVAKWFGVGFTVVAVTIYGMGVWRMGQSWRLGIDRNMTSPLVTSGIFAFSRNPIYLGFDLLFIGSVLIHGRLVLLLLLVILVPLLHYHVLREEAFLAKRFGDEYRSYCNRVGRYMTWRLTRSVP